jgi:hypothetical protein
LDLPGVITPDDLAHGFIETHKFPHHDKVQEAEKEETEEEGEEAEEEEEAEEGEEAEEEEEEIWFNGTSTQKGHIVPEVW